MAKSKQTAARKTRKRAPKRVAPEVGQKLTVDLNTTVDAVVSRINDDGTISVAVPGMMMLFERDGDTDCWHEATVQLSSGKIVFDATT